MANTGSQQMQFMTKLQEQRALASRNQQTVDEEKAIQNEPKLGRFDQQTSSADQQALLNQNRALALKQQVTLKAQKKIADEKKSTDGKSGISQKAQQMFREKTKKWTFRAINRSAGITFWGIVITEIVSTIQFVFGNILRTGIVPPLRSVFLKFSIWYKPEDENDSEPIKVPEVSLYLLLTFMILIIGLVSVIPFILILMGYGIGIKAIFDPAIKEIIKLWLGSFI